MIFFSSTRTRLVISRFEMNTNPISKLFHHNFEKFAKSCKKSYFHVFCYIITMWRADILLQSKLGMSLRFSTLKRNFLYRLWLLKYLRFNMESIAKNCELDHW